MGSDENGLRQTPFADAWATPDLGGTGLNGTGAGLDPDAGVNGLLNSPFSEAIVPTPSGARTADSFPAPPDTIQVDGGSPKGSQAPWDVTTTRNTVDRR